MQKPHARDDLLLQDVDDELVVYDPRIQKAHCLNRTAAAAFRACDGTASLSSLRRRVSSALDESVDDALLWRALKVLEDAQLLRAPLPRAGRFDPSRRRALRGLALGAAATVPAVWSVLAPTPAYAASKPCIQAQQCVPGSHACCGQPGQPAHACDGQGGCKSNASQCQGIICGR